MKIFNEYGNIDPDCKDLYKNHIREFVQDYIEKAKKAGASIVELRALESIVISTVTGVFAEDRLRTQVAKRKKEREAGKRSYKCFFSCVRCRCTYEHIIQTGPGPSWLSRICPACTYNNTPFTTERY